MTNKLDPKSEEFTRHIPIEEYSDKYNGERWNVDEHLDTDGIFVDLTKNPERYSGFNGSNIWHEVYVENLSKLNFTTSGPHANLLYRIISGIQVNVNMHISQYYLEDLEHAQDPKLTDFYRKYEIFYERIGKHPYRIKNLFYTYVFLLHALNQVKGNLPHYVYYPYDEAKNVRMQNRMKWFGHYLSGIIDPGKIEDGLFDNISKEDLVKIIKPTFKNITEIMECIG